MGIAISTLASLVRPFQRLLRRAIGSHSPLRANCSRPALHTVAGRAHVAWPPATAAMAQRRPLRVLRVLDAGQTPSSAGRMVISGRLADVCAELDRLASLEAAAA